MALRHRMQAAFMRARGGPAGRGVVDLTRAGLSMSRTAADALAAIALTHHMLGGRSPLDDGRPLGAVLAEGLDLETGPVLLRELEAGPEGEEDEDEEDEDEDEALEQLSLSARVTTQHTSRALRLGDDGPLRGALTSSSRRQALSAGVPGAETHLFRELPWRPRRTGALPALLTGRLPVTKC